MKKAFIALTATVLLIACNNEKKNDDKMSGDKKEEKKMSENITYPYKAEYSSDFSIGDANHSKLVLDFYKMWEDNKLDDMKAVLTDSVGVNFSDGSKFNNTSDSLIRMAKQFRSNYSSVKITVDAWMPVHVNDKNEDWVLIWNRSYNTDQKGKVDSTGGHSYWMIKNNKIAYWGEMQSKLTAPPPAKTK